MEKQREIEKLKLELEQKRFEYNQHAYRFFPYLILIAGFIILGANDWNRFNLIQKLFIILVFIATGYSSIMLRRLRKETERIYNKLIKKI